ncbi:alpha/beta fold hydrolase [Yinghuangia aomiensis]
MAGPARLRLRAGRCRAHLGYAHGVAGVGAFLLAAGRATGRGAYLDAALAAGRTLARTVRPDNGAAWWAQGPADPPGVRLAHWCSGASGVGTFLIRLWHCTGDPCLRDLAEQAAVAVRRARWHSGTTACHGLAGNGEFLLDIADLVEPGADDLYRAQAEECAELLGARSARISGRLIPCDESTVGVSASYGTGLAGVVGFLLRLRHGGPRLWVDPVDAASPASADEPAAARPRPSERPPERRRGRRRGPAPDARHHRRGTRRMTTTVGAPPLRRVSYLVLARRRARRVPGHPRRRNLAGRVLGDGHRRPGRRGRGAAAHARPPGAPAHAASRAARRFGPRLPARAGPPRPGAARRPRGGRGRRDGDRHRAHPRPAAAPLPRRRRPRARAGDGHHTDHDRVAHPADVGRTGDPRRAAGPVRRRCVAGHARTSAGAGRGPRRPGEDGRTGRPFGRAQPAAGDDRGEQRPAATVRPRGRITGDLQRRAGRGPARLDPAAGEPRRAAGRVRFPEMVHLPNTTVRPVAIAPDGERVALQLDRGATSRLAVWTPEEGTLLDIKMPDGCLGGVGRWTAAGLHIPFSAPDRPGGLATVRPERPGRFGFAGSLETPAAASGRPAWHSAHVETLAGDAGPVESIVYGGLDWRTADHLVVALHGGPAAAWRFEFSPVLQHLAAHGIAVVAPNQRGSIGYGEAYASCLHGAWGGPDLEDVAAIARTLGGERTAAGLAKPMLLGTSYGGYLALLAACTSPDAWSGVLAIAPFLSGPRLIAEASLPVRALMTRLGGDLELDDALGPRDVLRLAEGMRAPLLVVHGDRDDVIPVGQSRALRHRLLQLGRAEGSDFRYLELPGRGHEVFAGDGAPELYPRLTSFLTTAVV